MNWENDTKEYKRKTEEYAKVKYECKCGHRVIIPQWVDKQICHWCGHYVYKNKKDEFKDRINSAFKKGDK